MIRRAIALAMAALTASILLLTLSGTAHAAEKLERFTTKSACMDALYDLKPSVPGVPLSCEYEPCCEAGSGVFPWVLYAGY
ncbi:hypothetical protein E1292_25785 [Nonomuraea deserti]|uniref:Secreted protein n=1 Tax=Nonomuraea deserti TaxID=1848322 RepID=A0A4R4V932_9ACTN|nr:hypothetical protein [Nonomuraea deserti]TDD01512.1 hypothetical protein E1292_25785 [Nonomuraea deserti]